MDYNDLIYEAEFQCWIKWSILDEDYEWADYLIWRKDSKDNNVSEIFWFWEIETQFNKT